MKISELVAERLLLLLLWGWASRRLLGRGVESRCTSALVFSGHVCLVLTHVILERGARECCCC